MYKKIYLLLMCVILCSCMVSASTINIGDYPITIEQDTCWEIPFTCDNCTYVNVTVAYPNGSIILDNQEMTSNGGFYYNHTFCNTSTLGKYFMAFHYDDDAVYSYTDLEWFRVTPNGVIATEGNAILYIGGLGLLFILLLTSIIGCIKIDHYIGKFACYWTSHLLFVILMFSAWQLLEGFLVGYIGLAMIFRVLFFVSISAMFPMVILSIAWIVYMHTVTEEISDMMDRGMTSEEAWSRSAKSGRSWWKW